MKKVGISTVYTGYNYGSALQTFAVKMICKELGYTGVVLHLGGSVIRGRDVRMGKAFTIALRLLSSPKKAMTSVRAYASGMTKAVPKETQQLFDEFICEHICPVVTTWKGLKKRGKQKDYLAFICGSDQIWNSDALYVDPQYYLRYAPKHKRIAFAPSFGRHSVAEYNKKPIGKFVTEIPYLSVREQSGISIVKQLTGRDSVCLLDPTLFFNKTEWAALLPLNNALNKPPYLFAYFLDKPSEQAMLCIKKIAHDNHLEIISLPYSMEKADWFDHTFAAGPLEFIDTLSNAAFVCTDSFHGTAFSLIMQIPFYTFERQYGVAGKQSARIESVLELVGLQDRYCPSVDALNLAVNFTACEQVLAIEKARTTAYLSSAIATIEGVD